MWIKASSPRFTWTGPEMIKGVSMQNFMSYVNAYVPLKPGLNLICGPNGAGKSSILLAISLVLGQTYTERARRL
ncbi:MAG: ATP-binding protein, partial [Candidatus Bathyarchaeia archaeon]